MKHLLTRTLPLLMLCLHLLISLPATVSATGSTTVSATVISQNAPQYQISIPASIEATGVSRTTESTLYSKSFDVTVSDVSALNGNAICIRLHTADGFVLCNEHTGDQLPFAVYGAIDPATPLQNGDLFARFTEAATATGAIEIDRRDIPAEGTYKGQLLFSVTVE